MAFSEGVTVDLGGKCFTINRIFGEVGEERRLGDVCLVELKHKKLYGCFTEGMYASPDRWVECPGVLLVKPAIIKAIVAAQRDSFLK
jgi:hypothetical protein